MHRGGGVFILNAILTHILIDYFRDTTLEQFL